MIILDSSAIIDLTRGREAVKRQIESAESEGVEVATTTISFFEIFSRIYHRGLKREQRIFRSLFRHIKTLDLDHQSADEAAKVMGSLLKIGRPINVLDVIISGIALANGAERIVTGDYDFKEVEKVTDLHVTLTNTSSRPSSP